MGNVKKGGEPSMTLAEFIKLKRMGRGLSQTELSYISGLSPALLSRIESGHHVNMEMFTIIRLEKALKLKRGELFAFLRTSMGLDKQGRSRNSRA